MPVIDDPPQTHAESIARLRMKILDLQRNGVLSGPAAELYRTQLLEVLTEVERFREKAEREAQRLYEQMLRHRGYAEGQKNAFTQLRSIVEGLMNAAIARAQDEAELARQENQDAVERLQSVISDEDEAYVCECGRSFSSQRGLSAHKRRCKGASA